MDGLYSEIKILIKTGGKKMKRLTSWIVLCLCISASHIAYAHPGKTDSQGGHHNGSNYHFHHGQPAHYHTNGVCEYDNVWKYNEPWGGSGEYKGYKYKEPEPKKPEPVRIKLEGFERNISYLSFIIVVIAYCFLFCSPCIIVFLFGTIMSFIAYCEENTCAALLEKYKTSENILEDSINKVVDINKKIQTVNSLVPKDTKIDSESLPKLKQSKGWGDKYTFYTSKSGRVLHSEKGCSGATIPVNIAEYINYDMSKILCKKCNPYKIIPDMEWYKTYKYNMRPLRKKSMLLREINSNKIQLIEISKECNRIKSRLISKKKKSELENLNLKYNQLAEIYRGIKSEKNYS